MIPTVTSHWLDDRLDRDYGDELPPGFVVGDYVICERIGRGGCSTVYRAQRCGDAMPVAVKVLHPFLSSAPQHVKRFLREARTLQLVRHSSIPDVHDAGHLDDHRPYLVTEFVDGVNLTDFMATYGRLSPSEALELLEPICHALAHAHEVGVIHRDVKPSNVMIGMHDGVRRVKLLDFGIAKLLEPEPGPDAVQTSVGVILGSILSLAPEQILGHTVDARTDIYALGVLTYIMLTGTPPFDGPDELTITQMHLDVAPRNPSEIAPVPRAADPVLQRALAKSARDRYSSAPAFLKALRSAIEQAEHQPGLRAVPALAVHVEGRVDGGIDDAVLVDLVTMVDIAAARLEHAGMQVLLQTNQAVLAVQRVSDDADRQRAHIIDVARRLYRELAGRPRTEGRVHINVCVHRALARVHESDDSADTEPGICGGPITEVDQWVPQHNLAGVHVTPQALGRARDGDANTLRPVTAEIAGQPDGAS